MDFFGRNWEWILVIGSGYILFLLLIVGFLRFAAGNRWAWDRWAEERLRSSPLTTARDTIRRPLNDQLETRVSGGPEWASDTAPPLTL